ncbi:hypothetical protein B0A49_13692, partial [Cryomyces minteri]
MALLESGANIDAQDPQNQERISPLYAASDNGHMDIVKILLDRGANVNVQAEYFVTALQAASAKGHEKIVELLLNGGANDDVEASHYGTALQAASATGFKKTVELLLNRGANVNVEAGRYGTALQTASAHGHEKIVELLLDRGANVNVEAGRYGTALQAASATGFEKIVELLLDRGANVNVAGYFGTALQAASATGREKIVELLLRKGANIDAQGGCEIIKITRLLLEKGADVNAQGGKHGNALQSVVSVIDAGLRKRLAETVERGMAVVDLLLQNGAYIDVELDAQSDPGTLNFAEGNGGGDISEFWEDVETRRFKIFRKTYMIRTPVELHKAYTQFYPRRSGFGEESESWEESDDANEFRCR